MADDIAALIEELSEDAYAAAWMKDAEYDVWRLATEGGKWGQIHSRDEGGALNRLLRLAGEGGQWVRWSDDDGPVAVPLQEWRHLYAAWRERLGGGEG